MDFEQKIKDTLQKSNIDTTEGSVVDDLFIRKFMELHGELVENINGFHNKMSFKNFYNLSKEDQIRFAENFFVDINQGDKATGVVRLYFKSTHDVVVPESTIFRSTSGKEFVTEIKQQMKKDDMLNYNNGNYYYFDVDIVAKEKGDSYNVESGEIVFCTNIQINNLVEKISNPLKISGGQNSETPEKLYKRIQQSLTVRNMINSPSINSVLRSKFPQNIVDIHVVRSGHIDMLRDIVEINNRYYRVGSKYDIWIYSNDTISNIKETTVEFNATNHATKDGRNFMPFGYSQPILPDAPPSLESPILSVNDDDYVTNYECIDQHGNHIKDVVTEIKKITVSNGNAEFVLNSGLYSFVQKPGMENSTRQQSVIEFHDISQVPYGKLKIEYYGNQLVPEIQKFVTDTSRRLPLADPLVKYFKKYRLYGNIKYRGNVEKSVVEKTINKFIRFYDYNPERRTLDSSSGYASRKYFEVSDIINSLYKLGVTKVYLPLVFTLRDINGNNVAVKTEIDDGSGGTIKLEDAPTNPKFYELDDEIELKSFEVILPGNIIVEQEV